MQVSLPSSAQQFQRLFLKLISKIKIVPIEMPRGSKMTSGQSYKHFTIVIYESRVVI